MNAQSNCHNQKQIDFINGFNGMQYVVHQTAIEKGWWALPREVGTVLMNCVTELAEMFDALAHRNPYDKHCPDFTAAEVARIIVARLN